ncbi:MAG: hypothetical protein IJM44_00945 [Ruminococcus sp.]|nr:hypothetical protein [Ruminococcus sp.]
MKNRDILLDVIGETDEELVPELTEKKRSRIKRTVIGGVCAAAVIAGAVTLYPKLGRSPDRSAGSCTVLAAAVYPQIPAYPGDEDDYGAYQAWSEAVAELRSQPEGYTDGFDTFFVNSTQVFLSGAEDGNAVYSPLSLYMALGVTAEITDGSSRQQILDVLGQSDIETLRAHSRSIWQADYMDDGMAKCVLATSLWTNSSLSYRADTMEQIAESYYSSVYSGDPADEGYSTALHEWLNEQTGELLTDYVSGIEMDPEMVLTLASTVDYCGKWVDKFSAESTEQSVFHAAGGDVTCDFMNAERDMEYRWGESFSSVSLPLENNGHMKLILPDESCSPADLLSDTEVWELLKSQWYYPNSKYVTVTLSVPKFDVSSDTDLREGLLRLGVSDVFTPDTADLSPLTDEAEGICLSQAKQDTRVTIDEDGCRASSMTVMEVCGEAEPDDHAEFILDRPFIFEIMSAAGLPLFVGIVNVPV